MAGRTAVISINVFRGCTEKVQEVNSESGYVRVWVS